MRQKRIANKITIKISTLFSFSFLRLHILGECVILLGWCEIPNRSTISLNGLQISSKSEINERVQLRLRYAECVPSYNFRSLKQQ